MLHSRIHTLSHLGSFLFLTIAWLFGLLSMPAPAAAQTIIRVPKNTAQLIFPRSITFSVSISSLEPVERVTLWYSTNGASCSTSANRQAIEFEPGSQLDLNWKWDFARRGALPPGAQVWWQWEILTNSGETLVTDKQQLDVIDRRYRWQERSYKSISVYWVDGGAAFGDFLLENARASLKNLEEDAGVKPPGAVRLVIYPSTDELLSSFANLPAWAGGVAFPEYGTIMIGIPPEAREWAEDVIPHELAHMVTDAQVFNCKGVHLPTWLSEGLAEYAQGPIDERDLEALEDALDEDSLPALSSLTAGFSPDPMLAGLSYTQSGQVVSYLISEHGPEKITDLLAAMQSGLPVNQAMLSVYGFDTDDLDTAWRKARGYDARNSGKGTPPAKRSTKAAPTAIPTLALWTPSFGQATKTLAATQTPSPEPTEAALADEPGLTPTPQLNTEPGAQAPDGGSSLWIYLAVAAAAVFGLLTGWFVIKKKGA